MDKLERTEALSETHSESAKSKINFKIGTKEIWIKGLYILFFIVAGYLMVFITFFAMLFQFFAEIIFKKPNEHIQNFGETLGLYASSLIRFITGATNEMPFPFKPWPKAGASADTKKH